MVAYRWRLRRSTEAGAATSTTPLLDGELGWDGTTIKLGDGETLWSELGVERTLATKATRADLRCIRKTLDQTVNSLTSTVADSELFAPLDADSVYTFEAVAFYDSPTAADIKFSFDAPAGATLKYTSFYLASSISSVPTGPQFGKQYAAGDVQAVGSVGGTTATVLFKGMVRTAVTAGNLQLRFAQNVSDVGNTTVKVDSHLTILKHPFG